MKVVSKIKIIALVFAIGTATNTSAQTEGQRCRTIAAAVAAEIKVSAIDSRSADSLGAAKEGALRGCLAALNTSETDPISSIPSAVAPEKVEIAAAESNSTSEDGGFFDILSMEAKRTDGHKRLRQRGR